MRDYQKQRVYDWQQTVPHGGTIELPQAQSIVNHIWEAERLMYAPRVEPIDHRTTKWAGKANRMTIYLQPTVSLRTIIHEVAHSLTTDFETGRSALHGPVFVGMFAKLLEKHINVPMPMMLYTLNKYGVDIDMMAHPIFLDD